MREAGTYRLDELVSDIDGTTAYRYADTGAGESWQNSQRVPDESITWTCEPDDESDDLELSITADAYAILVERARTHCTDCAGGCSR